MPLIPEGVIDEIQTRADIAELIGRYVPLKRAGRHFKALCPFHKERTPSFMVNTDKQVFHCFGCGVGGNVFSFLMQHDRLTFPEAVRQLAEHVGIQVPEREADDGNGSHERLFALMEKACQYFERMLNSPQQGKTARAYLQQRGVPESAQRTFRLGLAPAGWDGLLKAAKATGVPAEQLEAAGLCVKGSSGYYDRFRNRLMFSIQNFRGKIVGFGGRSLDGKEPKYLNSPETAIYTKGQHLFGLAQTKDAIMKMKTAVVVEGYFDCVVLAAGGIPHVVSPLGTAMTIEQARLLKRYAERAVLAFDPDAAGEQATLRGIDLLVEVGVQVHVAQLPRGVDPDECLRSYGRERFQRLLDEGMNIFEFLVHSALRRYPARSGVEAKVRAAQFVLPTIAKVPNAMLRTEYVRLLADRLHLDEQAVSEELTKIQPRPHANSLIGALRLEGRDRRIGVGAGPERLVTALVLDEPTLVQRVQEAVAFGDVTDPTLHRILELVAELQTQHGSAHPAQVISRMSKEGQPAVVAELLELAHSVSSKEEAFEEALRRLRANTRRRELAALREQIRTAQAMGAEAEVKRLLATYQQQVKGGAR